MPGPDDIRSALRAYAEAYSTGDREAFLGLFARDAVWHDPVGADPHIGHEGIGAFWDTTQSMADRITLDVDRIVVGGNEAMMVFRIVARVGDGAMGFEAVETFEFGDDGRITLAKAYWDPSDATAL